MTLLQGWFCAIRPKTLSASIAPILLGQVLAYRLAETFSIKLALLILLCAVLLQISVNFANDYFDDIAGVDTNQRLGPLKTIQAGLLTRYQIKQAMLLTLISACFIGLYLIYLGGVIYLILGALCIGAVLGYSAGPKPLASIALGEVTVFFFFGPIALLGGLYLQITNQALNTDLTSLIIYSVQMGLFAAAIMLVNNIRDIQTDTQAKKHSLAVYLKAGNARLLYSAMLAAIPCLAYLNQQSLWTISCAAIAASALAYSIFQRQAQTLNTQLAQTAAFMLFWSIVCSIELLI